MKRIFKHLLSNEVAASYEPEYQAILDLATAQGFALPSEATKTAHNTFVAALKTAGLWGSFDMLNIYYGDMTQDFARINWVNPVVGALATLVNAPTYTNKRGFNSDGSSSYIDLNWDPTTGPNYGLNNAALGYFGYNDAASSRIFGASDSRIRVSANNGGGNSYIAVNSLQYFGTLSTNDGLIGAVRTDVNTMTLYRNAVVVDSDNGTASTSIPDHLHVLSVSGAFAPNTWQVQAAFAGRATLYADAGVAISAAFNNLMSTSL